MTLVSFHQRSQDPTGEFIFHIRTSTKKGHDTDTDSDVILTFFRDVILFPNIYKCLCLCVVAPLKPP